MLFLIIFPLALALWIYAERRLGIAARICAGIACIVLIACGSYFTASVTPSYERQLHRSTMRMTGDLLSKGETQRVAQAVGIYNSIADTGTTYRASMEMWDVLNRVSK